MRRGSGELTLRCCSRTVPHRLSNPSAAPTSPHCMGRLLHSHTHPLFVPLSPLRLRVHDRCRFFVATGSGRQRNRIAAALRRASAGSIVRSVVGNLTASPSVREFVDHALWQPRVAVAGHAGADAMGAGQQASQLTVDISWPQTPVRLTAEALSRCSVDGAAADRPVCGLGAGTHHQSLG